MAKRIPHALRWSRIVVDAPLPEFIGTCLRLAFTHAWGVSESAATLLAVAVYVLGKFPSVTTVLFGEKSSQLLAELSTGDAVAGLVLGIMTIRAGLSPYWAYREAVAQRDRSARRLRGLTSHRLRIVYDPATCAQMRIDLNPWKEVTHVIRVENPTASTITGVTVRLERCTPRYRIDTKFLPCPLVLANDWPAKGQPYVTSFTLDPEQSQEVKVVSKSTVDEETKGDPEHRPPIEIHFASDVMPYETSHLAATAHLLRIVARGYDTPEVVAYFLIDVDERSYLTFEEVDAADVEAVATRIDPVRGRLRALQKPEPA